MFITYHHFASTPRRISVYCEGKLTGYIRIIPGGFQYFPKGMKTGGEVFTRLENCKASLEAE